MSGHSARIRAIEALVAGRPCIAGSAAYPVITREFREVHAVRKIRKSARRRLLEVFHGARALDTLLSTFVNHYGCQVPGKKPPKAMGPYLYALRDHTVSGLGHLAEGHRSTFQSNVVTKRNHYLHEAGAFPMTDSEVNVLLADMDTCISIVMAL